MNGPEVQRRQEWDVARGLMLVLMTVTHLPIRLSDPAGQPLGFVSAAEGFVLLSAFMAGMVYTRRAMSDGLPVMRQAFLRRALVVYGCQAALLVFLFTVIAALGVKIDQPAVKNLMSFYLQEPLTALWSGLLLVYSPPLLDILPLYIVFMLASPWVLAWGLQRGWTAVMAASLLAWWLAQFDVSAGLYQLIVQATGLPVPFRETGSFEMFAWQFLWVLGLWLGTGAAQASGRAEAAVSPLPRPAVAVCAAYALVCFVWRHAVGQVPMPSPHVLNDLFDKWHLAPLRLLNFLALLVLAIEYGTAVVKRLPFLSVLAPLGRASLPVFCAHLVLVLLLLAVMGEIDPQRPLLLDAMILAATIVVLYAVAEVSRRMDERANRSSRARPRAADAGNGLSES